jgi:hypothetical protein
MGSLRMRGASFRDAAGSDPNAVIAAAPFKPSLYQLKVIGRCRARADRTPG